MKGIKFGELHSFNDLNLILSACEITPATPKETYIELPGGDGSLDFTEVHGEVKYNDREACKFTFTMNPSDGLSDEDWENKKKEVSNKLNGKYFEKIILDSDPGYYYQGRCRMEEYASDRRIRKIVVSARLKPYKYKKDITEKTFTLSSTAKTVTLINSRKTAVPEITCSADNQKIVFGSVTKTLSKGTHKVLDIQLVEGDNSIKISGSGTMKFIYQEADL